MDILLDNGESKVDKMNRQRREIKLYTRFLLGKISYVPFLEGFT